MKRIVLFTAILMATIVVKAQGEEGDFTIQPKVGINLSSLSDADKAIVEVNFGFEGEYMLTDNLSFAAGVIVSNQGAKYDSSSAGSYTADLDYANVPVVLNYYVLPGLAIKAGVQPGFRVKAKAKTDGASVDLDEMYGIISKATGEEVKISAGVPAKGKKFSKAWKLARKYMRKYYPEWFAKYKDVRKSISYLKSYSKMAWTIGTGKSVMSDPDGLRNMNAEQVLRVIFHEV